MTYSRGSCIDGGTFVLAYSQINTRGTPEGNPEETPEGTPGLISDLLAVRIVQRLPRKNNFIELWGVV